jgi:hypothetical protein
MPTEEVYTSISKVQRAAMNTGVESVRRPVRFFWDREPVHEDEEFYDFF